MNSRTRKLSTRKISQAASSGTNTATPFAETPPTHLFHDSTSWEAWLQINHSQSLGLWLKLSKKGATIATLTYDQALDVALCYGWIDGQRKTFDDQHFIQRFTPRRKASLWSKRNVGKVAALIEAGRMQDAGQAEIEAARKDGRWERAYAGSSTIEVPGDLEKALNEKPEARKSFDRLNKTQRYQFLMRLETVKRPETRQRRIKQFAEMLEGHNTL